MEYIFRIGLQANCDFGTYKKGDKIEIINDVFNDLNGIARFPIDKEWDIIYKDLFADLTDKSGIKVFKGDKLKFNIGSRSERKVIFNNGAFGFVGIEDNRDSEMNTFTEFVPICTIEKELIKRDIFDDLNDLIEVIGNIHDK